MADSVLVCWSFRSPYSYLAIARLRDLAGICRIPQFGDAAFFGQDRIDSLIWRLGTCGLLEQPQAAPADRMAARALKLAGAGCAG
jgi:2-hydroxychromene-2-carboxylate isomerase